MQLKYQLLQTVSLPKGQVRGRYAPSPSGVQHLGNIRTAMVAWLQARLSGGEFIMRMDDLDTPRVKFGSAEQILDDLHWLGLDWDVLEAIHYGPDHGGVYVQSVSQDHYQQAFSRLQNQGRVFPCDCSRKAIAQKVGKPNAGGHFVYPGTCRNRSLDEFPKGEALAWRYRVADEVIAFDDVLMGIQSQNVAQESGDAVIKRRDGIFAYQLASVVDDIDMRITDVVRGVDLLDSTPVQIALFRALGAESPRFWHLPLKTDADGNKLAKRDGSDSLLALREAGVSAEWVVGALAFELGLIEREEVLGLSELLQYLSAEAGKAPYVCP